MSEKICGNCKFNNNPCSFEFEYVVECSKFEFKDNDLDPRKVIPNFDKLFSDAKQELFESFINTDLGIPWSDKNSKTMKLRKIKLEREVGKNEILSSEVLPYENIYRSISIPKYNFIIRSLKVFIIVKPTYDFSKKYDNNKPLL